MISETKAASLIRGNRHEDVYCLPREDTDFTSLATTDRWSYDDFKTHSIYWIYTGNSNLKIFWRYDELSGDVEAICQGTCIFR
jgi:uncharacterized protein (DUF427 family)